MFGPNRFVDKASIAMKVSTRRYWERQETQKRRKMLRETQMDQNRHVEGIGHLRHKIEELRERKNGVWEVSMKREKSVEATEYSINFTGHINGQLRISPEDEY